MTCPGPETSGRAESTLPLPADYLSEATAQKSLRDLMGLLALPALWAGRDSRTVLRLMTEAIERIVQVRAIYIDVPLPDQESNAVFRLDGRAASETASASWREVLSGWEALPFSSSPSRFASPVGSLRVVRMSLGYSAKQGSVWFADHRADFPTVTQLAFLRAATSLAATGLQGAHMAHEREQASRAKDEFLAMLGHELRNPLAPISTALELIKRKSEAPPDKYHAIIERQVHHLSTLVDDLLDVSRVARGKIELQLEHLRIGPVIERSIEAVSPLIEQRQHRLHVDIKDGDTPLMGDLTRLTQIFVNLLTNAAKYTQPCGLIHIESRISGDTICVSIRDNGAGIAPELMPRLFSIFEQGRTTIDRSRGGLGIGLALVKSLVGLHGGEVRAISAGVDQGSEFTVHLPMSTAVLDDETVIARRPLRVIKLQEQQRRVLLVDDNIDSLDAMEAFLGELGFNVAATADPIEALNIAAVFNPHVAVLDIGLPGMDGYQLAEELRARQGQQAMRLLALSGYGQPGDRERSRAAGFDQHFVKPIALPDLVAALAPESSNAP